MLLIEDVVLCETTIRVYAPEEHSLADVSVTSSTLEAFAAEDVGLARDNIAFAEVRDLLANLDDFSGELVSHHHWRLDLVSDRFVPVVDVHVRPTDRGGLDPDENVPKTGLGCRPLLEDRAGTRRRLHNSVHLFFQQISSKLGLAAQRAL